MADCRARVVQLVAENVKLDSAVDVYRLVEELRDEFPNLPEPELVRMVGEEVIACGACSYWEKRERQTR